ncbi:MAG: ribose-phosphate diphosphokinase [Pseudomonadota bacterium]
MKDILIVSMPGDLEPAKRLAAEMAIQLDEIHVRQFPDGESCVRAPEAASTTILYQSLDRPNEKLIELTLAASALRDLGAERLVLVAPYLCYMRQDIAFQKGEAVSQRVIGAMLAQWFDRVVTIDPHLHRTQSLSDVLPKTEATVLSATSLLAGLIHGDGAQDEIVIVGPDLEATHWTEALASAVGAPYTVLEKKRMGDREVSISFSEDVKVSGKRVYLVDDVASTGNTLATAARLLSRKGAARIEAVVSHALFDKPDLQRMNAAGIVRIRSTDSVKHATNAVAVAPLLGEALRREGRP